MDPSDKGSWVGRSFLNSLLGSADVVVIGGHVTVVVVSTSGKKKTFATSTQKYLLPPF